MKTNRSLVSSAPRCLSLVRFLLLLAFLLGTIEAFAPPLSTTQSSPLKSKGFAFSNANVVSSQTFASNNSLNIKSSIGASPLRSTTTTCLHLSLPSTIQSLFTSAVPIPLGPSLLLNASLFLLLQSKLKKMLTPEGFVHSFALGSMLWYTLGWKGWTTCVLYLFLGQAVTKVKFQEKEDMGIAEGRGGRRGPENVWCVYRILYTYFILFFSLVCVCV